eukprot:22707-Chlamydomonas_euryale.AAC.3
MLACGVAYAHWSRCICHGGSLGCGADAPRCEGPALAAAPLPPAHTPRPLSPPPSLLGRVTEIGSRTFLEDGDVQPGICCFGKWIMDETEKNEPVETLNL